MHVTVKMKPPQENVALYWEQSSFEKDTNLTESEIVNDWIDPYGSYLLKISSIILYSIELLESFVMIAFVIYETSGAVGHYRTLINQLLSFLYGGVCSISYFLTRYPITLRFFVSVSIEPKNNLIP